MVLIIRYSRDAPMPSRCCHRRHGRFGWIFAFMVVTGSSSEPATGFRRGQLYLLFFWCQSAPSLNLLMLAPVRVDGVIRGEDLARISHRPSTTHADLLAVSGRTPDSRLDVVSAAPSPSSGPYPRHSGISTPSRRLRGEICGLVECHPNRCGTEHEPQHSVSEDAAA